jgi:hypothetical protein
MPLCLSAGAATAALAVNAFTLAWMHSIEKTRWEEDWRIEGSLLRVVAASIRGQRRGHGAASRCAAARRPLALSTELASVAEGFAVALALCR